MSGDRRAARRRTGRSRDLDAAPDVEDQAAVAAGADLGESLDPAHRADDAEILAVVRARGAERVDQARPEAERRPGGRGEEAVGVAFHRSRSPDMANAGAWLEKPEDRPAPEHCEEEQRDERGDEQRDEGDERAPVRAHDLRDEVEEAGPPVLDAGREIAAHRRHSRRTSGRSATTDQPTGRPRFGLPVFFVAPRPGFQPDRTGPSSPVISAGACAGGRGRPAAGDWRRCRPSCSAIQPFRTVRAPNRRRDVASSLSSVTMSVVAGAIPASSTRSASAGRLPEYRTSIPAVSRRSMAPGAGVPSSTTVAWTPAGTSARSRPTTAAGGSGPSARPRAWRRFVPSTRRRVIPASGSAVRGIS